MITTGGRATGYLTVLYGYRRWGVRRGSRECASFTSSRREREKVTSGMRKA